MNYFHDSSIGADCPVRGCVGPELAAGDFMAAFQRFREITSAEVLRLVADVSPQSRLKILCDFERGHQHLQYVFALKLGSLSGANPYKFIALGHHDLVKAAHVCKEAYDIYLSSSDGGANDDDQHPLTIMLCSSRTDDPELRFEFITFIHDDEPLSQLNCRVCSS